MPDSSELTYEDFDIEIDRGRGRKYPVNVLRGEGGEARETMQFPFNERELESHLKDLKIAIGYGGRGPALSKEQRSVQDFGSGLFEALLTGEIKNRFDTAMEKAKQKGKGLRLKLHIRPPNLAALPWEFLYEPRQAEYMGLIGSISIVRYPEHPRPIQPLTVKLPLRILGMAVSPTDECKLEISDEKQQVEEAVKNLRDNGFLELTWLPGQTWRDLLKAMHEPWHIFHFIGHGGFDQERNEGFIVLADEKRGTRRISARELGILLAGNRGLRLVILNSCEGAMGDERDLNSSTASILIQRGIPAVLAMQYKITDKAAIEFSRTFYDALADRLPVDAAVAEARKAISIQEKNSLEWGTPVLYMRSLDGVLFNIQPGDLSTLYSEAIEALGAKDWQKAIKLFREIFAIEPGYRDVSDRLKEAERGQTQEEKLSALYSEGMEALGSKDRQKAIKLFKEVLAIEPGYRDAGTRLKEAEQQSDLAKEKEKAAEEAQLQAQKEAQRLEKERKEARQAELSALYSKGMQALKVQDWRTAIIHFNDILTLDADYGDARARLKEAEQQLELVREIKRQHEIKKLQFKAKIAVAIMTAIAIAIILYYILSHFLQPVPVLTAINVSPAEASFAAGGGGIFTAVPLDQFSNPIAANVTWSSSNAAVGTVDSAGWFTGIAAGTATITAARGSISGTATVNVTPREEFINSIGMKFMKIPAGEFEMGSLPDEIDRYEWEGPLHTVVFSKAFYMGEFEVNQTQWFQIMRYNASFFKGDDLPVERVKWDDVQKFIKKLNEKERTNKYHLPSEAEWEYAARAGTTTNYSFGDNKSKLGDYAWYNENANGTRPIGKKKPNAWELFDMQGNVWEWVQDKWRYDYNDAPVNGSAWESKENDWRVVRGCSFYSDAKECRAAYRTTPANQSYFSPDLGFRVVKDL